MRESALWKSFRNCLPPDAMAERIENSVGSGMPDVVVAYRKTFFVELKAGLEISRKQADWARRWAMAGGVSWFLIALNREHYLVPGSVGTRLIRQPDLVFKWRVDGIRGAIAKMLE